MAGLRSQDARLGELMAALRADVRNDANQDIESD